MANRWTKLVAGWAACAAWTAVAAPTAVTNYLTRVINEGPGSTETLNSAYWTDGRAAHPGADYAINLSGQTIRLPGTNSIFSGNSLLLGTEAERVSLYQKAGHLTFAEDGLFLRNVLWGHWERGQNPHINGRVTVLSPQSNPSSFASDNMNAGHTFTGPWFGGEGTGIDASARSEATYHNYTLSLLGDLGQYFGRIRVYRCAALRLGETVFPGTLVMDNEKGAGDLKTADVTTAVTVGTLELTAGTTLEAQVRLAAEAAPATNNSFRVANALRVAGPVHVTLPTALQTFAESPELRFPLLVKAASATGDLDLSGFALTNASPKVTVDEAYALAVAMDEATGDTALELVRRPVVALTRDTTAKDDPDPENPGKTANVGALTTTNYWSDAAVPHPGSVYFSNGKVLRTYYADTARGPRMEDVFAGDALVVDSSFVMQAQTVVVSNLYFQKSAAGKRPAINNWHGNGDKTTNTFAVGGTKVLTGNRMVLREDADGSFSGIGGYIRIDSPLEGPGQLSLGVTDGARSAYTELAGDNAKWTGRLLASVSTTLATRGAFNYTNTCEVLFRKPCHLGGPRPVFDASALMLQNKAVLHPLESVTWDEPTRGLTVQDQGGGIRTDAGTVFTLGTQLTLQGTLGKLGAGTLVLGGTVAFGTAANFDPGTTPFTVEVLEGGLRTCAKAAADGVTFAFGAAGALEADPAATGDAAAYGLYDVKTDMPFDRTTAPNGRVPVRVVLPADYAENPRSVSATICTVNATAAAALGPEAFAVARPSRCRTSVTAQTNDDGTVTYTAHVAPGGFTVIVR